MRWISGFLRLFLERGRHRLWLFPLLWRLWFWGLSWVVLAVSCKFPARHIVCWIRSKIRFDEGIDLFLEVVQLLEDVNLRGDLLDFFMNVVKLWISIVVLSDEVFVVGVSVLFIPSLFNILGSSLIVCAHYILDEWSL